MYGENTDLFTVSNAQLCWQAEIGHSRNLPIYKTKIANATNQGLIHCFADCLE